MKRHIKKVGSEYWVYNEDETKVLGKFKTKAEAEKQLEAVEANKDKEGKSFHGPDVERRHFIQSLELRAAPEGSTSPGTAVGYAAVFRGLSLDLGGFREQIAPGAFTEALKTCDVRALFNHKEDHLLGRSTAGTLRMSEDSDGLRYELDLPNTDGGRNVAELIRRKDLTGCSFSFTTDVDEWDTRGEIPVRTVRKIRDLYDVGPVTFPAYEQTSVAMRSLEAARAAQVSTPTPAPEPDPSLSLALARQRLAEAF